MMHFCADVRMVNNSGIGVYIRHYIRYILQNNLYKTTLLGRKAEINQHFGEFANMEHVEADFPIYSVQEQVRLPMMVPACDVFWSPHYNIPLLPIRARKHLVTVPDVFHLAYYHTLSLPQKLYAKVVANAAVRKPDQVTTISHYSKKEIVTLTGADAAKIKVIHLGLNQQLFRRIDSPAVWQRVKQQYHLPEQYILFVGNVKPNKNLRTLVEAFALLLGEYPELNLLIVGKKEGFITQDNSLFERLNSNAVLAERVRFTGYVDIDDLPVLYSMAAVFAFPSLYEGFGFPPLEAMACGCPVVASNATSIPEICGDSVRYADPHDSAAIASGLREVLSDEDLRKRLINAGYGRIQQFRWDDSCRQFVAIIDSLLPDNQYSREVPNRKLME